MLIRIDKQAGSTIVYSDSDEAVQQYRIDFHTKADQTAKVHLFDLLMGKHPMIQNAVVAWQSVATYPKGWNHGDKRHIE